MIKFLFLVLFAILIRAEANFDGKERQWHDLMLEKEWRAFKIKFNKTYKDSTEDEQRKNYFAINRNIINRNNGAFELGLAATQMDFNSFGKLFSLVCF